MSSDTLSEGKVSIPPYSSPQKLPIVPWIKLFNKLAACQSLSPEWKLNHISEYLVEDAFLYYLENILDTCLSWDDVEQDLINRFQPIVIDPFEQFNALNLSQTQNNLQNYFDKKIGLGRKAGLTVNNIISGLNTGLSPELQFYMALQSPITLNDWFSTCLKIQYAQGILSKSKKNFTSQQVSLPHVPTGSTPMLFGPARPRYTGPSVTAPSAVQASVPTIVKPQNPNPRSPRSPCYFCYDRGLPDPYHYSNQCPNRRPRPTTGVPSSTEVKFANSEASVFSSDFSPAVPPLFTQTSLPETPTIPKNY